MSATKFKWAQDHRQIFLTVAAKNVGEMKEQVTVTTTAEGKFKFMAPDASLDLQLAEPMDPDHPGNSWSVKPNCVECVLRKASKAFWPFLLSGGKQANKLPNMDTDWDRWIDEDECEDTEDFSNSEVEMPPVPFEPSESAVSELSPLAADSDEERERFQGLKIEEKMVLFSSMWNSSSPEERETGLRRLIDLVGAEDPSKQNFNPDHIKGSDVLGDRDISQYPGVSITHLDAWMGDFKKQSSETKVDVFERCWTWCDDQEKKITMAGLM